MSWHLPYWFSTYPAPPFYMRPGFRLWWEHAPPMHACDVRLMPSPRIAMRGRNKSKGSVRMPRVRNPGAKRSTRL
jgi:hypothetical protein